MIGFVTEGLVYTLQVAIFIPVVNSQHSISRTCAAK